MSLLDNAVLTEYIPVCAICKKPAEVVGELLSIDELEDYLCLACYKTGGLNIMSTEQCCVCEEQTGKAGRADDSLFVNDAGPFCQECYDGILKAIERALLTECLDAMSLFVQRVQDGTIRSRRTYAQFTSILAKAKKQGAYND